VNDTERIKITLKEEGNGHFCRLNDWAIVHWKAYLKSGQIVEDSRLKGD